MADQTDKYNPAGPGFGPAENKDTTPSTPGGFKFYDGDGKTIGNVPTNANRQSTWSRTVTQDNKGNNTLRARYTGDKNYAPGSTVGYTENLGGDSQSRANTVDQIVPGPGIYISPKNGRGIVTISTEPIPDSETTEDLNHVVWPIAYNTPSVGDLRQFTVSGNAGVNLRSRDGVNFVEMGRPKGVDILCAIAEQSSSIADNHVEFSGVNGNQSIYGRLGMEVANNTQGRHQQDGMWVISTLTATSGVVAGLKTTFAWQNGGVYEASDPAGSGTGGGGGGGTTTGKFAISNYFIYDTNIGKSPITSFIREFSYGAVGNSFYITAPDLSYFGSGANSGKGEFQIYIDEGTAQQQVIAVGFSGSNYNPINATTVEFYEFYPSLDLTDNGNHTIKVKVYERVEGELILSATSPTINWTLED
jgi:hypothetical protein